MGETNAIRHTQKDGATPITYKSYILIYDKILLPALLKLINISLLGSPWYSSPLFFNSSRTGKFFKK